MKIPESVRIGGVEYTVKLADSLNDGVSVLYGQIDYDHHEIRISSTTGAEHQYQCITLWHEILHGLWRFFDIDDDREEEIVSALAKGIYMVLQDNARQLFGINEKNV